MSEPYRFARVAVRSSRGSFANRSNKRQGDAIPRGLCGDRESNPGLKLGKLES